MKPKGNLLFWSTAYDAVSVSPGPSKIDDPLTTGRHLDSLSQMLTMVLEYLPTKTGT